MSAGMETPPAVAGVAGQRRRRSWFTPGKKPDAVELAEQPPSPENLLQDKHGEQEEEEEEMEVLTLSHFTRPPKVDFGVLRPGQTADRTILIHNPHEYEQTVAVERFPFAHDFSLRQTEFSVDAESSRKMVISWSPTQLGHCRDVALFRVDGAYRLQAVLMGKLEEPPKKPKKVKKTWAQKPRIPVHPVLRPSNQANRSVSAPHPEGPRKRQVATSKPPPPAATKKKTGTTQQRFAKLRTPPRRSKSTSPVVPAGGDLLRRPPEEEEAVAVGKVTYINPQVPINAGLLMMDKSRSSPKQAPPCTPEQEKQEEETRRSTFDKSSPDMHNTPTIGSTPPKGTRAVLMQPRRLVRQRTPSPLACCKENQQPPLLYCEEEEGATPSSSRPGRRRRSKMRRSNTYTKLNEDGQDFSSPFAVQAPSSADSSTTDADNTVVERTEEVTEVVQVVTEYREEVMELEEEVEYLVTEDLVGGGTRCRQTSRSVRPVGNHLFSSYTVDTVHSTCTQQQQQQQEEETCRSNFDATRIISQHGGLPDDSRLSLQAPADATRVLSRHSDVSVVVDGRPSLSLPPADATRVLSRHSDVSIVVDGRPSLSLPPSSSSSSSGNSATFVKSPAAAGGVLGPAFMSETRVLTPAAVTGRLSCISEASSPIASSHDMNSDGERRVLSPENRSPRGFFSDLLALHDNKKQQQQQQPEAVGRKYTDFFGDCPSTPPESPTERRVSSLTVTKEKPFTAGGQIPAASPPRDGGGPEVNRRRISSLTVTKDYPTVLPARDGAPGGIVDVRQNRRGWTGDEGAGASGESAAARMGRCLFTAVSPEGATVRVPAGQVRSPEMLPLPNSPSPSGRSPSKMKIYGTNYPGSRSPRRLDGDLLRTPSPQKSASKREKARRRSSGQFRRRSGTYRADGSLVARGMRSDSSKDSVFTSPGDSSMSLSELTNTLSPKPREASADTIKLSLPPCNDPQDSHQPASNLSRDQCVEPEEMVTVPVHVNRLLARPPPSQPRVTATLSTVNREPPKASYLQPTSATQRRREAIRDSKKRDHSVEKKTRHPRSSSSARTNEASQQPVAKRAKQEVAPKTVVQGLTKTQQLRRQAALSTMGKTEKKVQPVTKPKVAQSKLRLIKTSNKTALPKHPMAFAAKNVYYDERWLEKQERGFVRWLNFILTPHEEESGAHKPQKVDAGALCLDPGGGGGQVTGLQPAPSKETLSFRLYSARRRLNNLRRQACRLFTSEQLVRFHHKLEVEVECQRLLVRPDRKIHADLGIKQNVLDLLLSYNPLWLRIGLETIYGEVLPVTSNSDIIGLSRFVVTRLMGNPDIATEYAHPSVPHLYRQGYDKAMAQFTLKKFLLLVVFLDKAKISRLVDHDPCLFCKDSDFKTSRSVLLAFARDYLSGEGDLCRHLGFMGYNVSHEQKAIDELEYAVNNLATDLRDGTRLTRLMAILTEQLSLTNELRVPVVSRLQKIHNVGVAFKILEDQGIDLSTIKGGRIDARNICDGHREKTHHLLWQIIFKFQVELVLNEDQLRDEIRFLRENLDLRKRMDALLNDDLESLGIPENRRDSTEMYFKSPRLSLLLTWCRAVCAFYGFKVENFTVSFSDGRALCYLVHHYHPSLLPLSDINEETTQTVGPGDHNTSVGSESDDSFSAVWSSSFSPTTGKPTQWDELLANERQNFRLLYERVSELGQVPLMIRSSDMSNTIPDEKVVITYITYLCARLLDIRHETRAARVIQVAWRHYRLHKQKDQLQVRREAAKKIQRLVRDFLRRRRHARQEAAALTIQRTFRGMLARKYAARLRFERQFARKIAAVVKIQACIRSWNVRRLAKRRLSSAVRIQTWWRMLSCRRAFLEKQQAAVVIQQRYRAHKTAHTARVQYLTLKAAVGTIQRAFLAKRMRVFLERRREEAATVIQANWKAYRSVKQYKKKYAAVVVMQRWYRARRQRRHYCRLRDAAVCIQAHLKSLRARRAYRRKAAAALRMQRIFIIEREAARTIQEYYRAYRTGRRQREEFTALKAAVRTVERGYLSWRERVVHRRRVDAVTVIQKHYRGFCAKNVYRRRRAAALHVQRWYRARRQRRRYLETRRAVLCIQAHIRNWSSRQAIKKNRAALVIQQRYRAYRAGNVQRAQFTAMKSAVRSLEVAFIQRKRRIALKHHHATILQAHWRGYVQRTRYRIVREAVVRLQERVRTKQERTRYLRMRSAAIVIQRRLRAKEAGESVRGQFRRQRSAAVVLQSAFRAHRQRVQFRIRREAVVRIQSQWRAHRTRAAYLKTVGACVVVQRRFRACLHARQVRAEYLRKREATVRIQSQWRSYVMRKRYLQLKRAATRLQSHVRQVLQERQYRRERGAAVYIQRWYRAHKLGQHDRREFYIELGALVTLQAAVRGWLVRRWIAVINKIKRSAILIQKHARGFLARRRYQRRRRAALTLQQGVRAWLVGRRDYYNYHIMRGACLIIQAQFRGWQQRTAYKRQRAAAVTIQALFRGYAQRKEYSQMREERKRACDAAVQIQAMFRGYSQHKQFLRLKAATVILQHHFRAYRQGHVQRQEFIARRSAARTIQPVVRGFLTRKALARKTRAAVSIQSTFRAYVVRRRYRRMLEATQSLQSIYRAHRLGRAERQSFLIQKGAAMTVQSVFRGFLVRRALKRRRQAAVFIQSRFQAVLSRRRFLRMRAAACVMQSAYRAHRLGRVERRRFLIQKGAAMTVQSVFRGFLVRRALERRWQATVFIQSKFRAVLSRRRFLQMRAAACVMQSAYRARQLGRRQRQEFLTQKGAALTVQAAFRGFQARRAVRTQQHAATCIQSQFRAFVTRRQFHQMREAARSIQSFFRAHRCRQDERRRFLIRKGAAMTVQAAFRGFVVRKHYSRQRTAAVLIQTHVRAFLARRRFRRRKTAARSIQSHYRAYRLGVEERQRFLIRRVAAITIQSAFRAFLVRRELCRKHRAATVIQSYVRTWRARRRFLLLRSSAVTIQSHYRAALLERHTRRQYLLCKRSVVTIQAVYRGHLVRKEVARKHGAATTIQSQFRSHLARWRFLRYKAAAVILQTHYRAYMLKNAERTRFLMQRKAIVSLQSHVRAYLIRTKWQRKQRAAHVIQAHFRGYMQKRRFLRYKAATIILQTHYRAYVSKIAERTRFLKQRKAVVSLQSHVRAYLIRTKWQRKQRAAHVIQAHFRGYMQRRRYRQLRQATIILQRWQRARLLQQQARRVLIVRRTAVVRIQSAVRRYITRKRLQRRHLAASTIQSVYKGFITRKRFLQKRSAALLIQRYYRAARRTRTQRSRYLHVRQRVVCIQSYARRWLVQREMEKRHYAAILLQAVVRGHQCRKRCAVLRREVFHQQRAAVVIQRCYRSYQRRKIIRERVERRRQYIRRVTTYTQRHLAAVRIQRTFRRVRVMRRARKEVHSVVIIQRWIRRRLRRIRIVRRVREEKERQSKEERAATRIQQSVRGWLARRRWHKLRQGVLRMQALWRGYRVRSAVRSVKVKAARRRVEAANANFTEDDKLCNITTRALDYLLRYRQLSHILNALIKLDKATRWSSACCEQMAASNGTDVIFTLIRSCNRSEPHMEIIKYAIEILLNLTKYEKTSGRVYESEGSVTTLVELLAIFREKGPIFTKTCTLLGLLCHQSYRYQEVHKMPKVVDKIRSIQYLTLRKYKMEEKRQLVKTRMAAAQSFSSSFSVPSTPQKTSIPRIEPEWVLRRQSIREIVDPLQAVKFLMNALHISSK